MRFDRQLATVACALSLLILTPWSWSRAEPRKIERIILQGLSRMDEQAFRYLFEIREGDDYDAERVRRQFRLLWDKRLFEDITIESETGPEGGVVLVIKVRERPVLASVTFEENKVLTKTQIEDHFKERKVELKPGQPLDMGQVFFAEAAIRDLFSLKGFLDSEVETKVTEVTTTSRSIEFLMTPGGKTRIHEIDFTGNTVFKDRKLKEMLRLVEERRWYWPWSAKNLYHPNKWDQDIAKIREAYLDRGYLDVETHAPVVDVREKEKKKKKKEEAQNEQPSKKKKKQQEQAPPPPEAAPPPVEPEPPDETLTPKEIAKRDKKRREQEQRAAKQAKQERRKAQKQREKESKRWVHLTAPLTEGPQYTLGVMSIEGNEVFPDEVLRAQIPQAEGAIINAGALRLGIDRITRLYEDRGHLYADVVQTIRRREGRIADVEIDVEEDKPYRVGRIEFQGNSATHDRVLRRELQLVEGDLFSRTKLDVSRTKVNQLGYFQLSGEPVIEPIDLEDEVRITMQGTEQGRNEVQVGGGFSGLEGAFFSGIYSTRNFLGRGQVLSAALQIGGSSNRYQLSFQEPWFLGRPYLFGLALFRRDIDYGNDVESTSTGGGVQFGRRLGNFTRLSVGYNYENLTQQFRVTVPAVDDEGQPIGGTVQEDRETQTKISSLSPTFLFSTVNSPYRPTRGTQFTTTVQLAGGPLGGSVSYWRPLINYTRYQRAFQRSFFALHAEAGYVAKLDDSETFAVHGVPISARFWLGGDTLGPRVFETRSIAPRRWVLLIDGTPQDVQRADIVGLPPTELVDIDDDGDEELLSWDLQEVGGDRMYLVQSEWVFPLNEQSDIVVFLDVGDALFEDTSLDFTTVRASSGLELRFHLPIFPVPLRLIYGFPLRELEGDSTGNFTFSIGRSF